MHAHLPNMHHHKDVIQKAELHVLANTWSKMHHVVTQSDFCNYDIIYMLV